MPCPFPGMDPYIERPEIWPDFHDRLIISICAVLQPLLRPRYATIAQDRLFVVEADGSIWRDLSVVEMRSSAARATTQTAVIEADIPAIFELWREEIRQPYIEIVETAAENRVVTAIEVLSPVNKLAGAGRSSYLRKRDEFWDSGINLVEIDLLRQGESTIRIPPEKLEKQLPPRHYLIAVSRSWPPRQEVYPVQLQRRLPKIKIPLADKDNDLTLELQLAFTRCWNEGPYPELLRYSGPPPGTMSAADAGWCHTALEKAGLLGTPPNLPNGPKV